MREIAADVDRWLAAEAGPIGLATVVETWGSAPRRPGAKMAFTAAPKISGSVSGGCVEGAVIEAGLETLASGRPQLLRFGVADETAWEVGLACGGEIAVFVEPLASDVYGFIRRLEEEEQSGACLTIVSGPPGLLGRKIALSHNGDQVGTLGPEPDALARLIAVESVRSGVRELKPDLSVFVDVIRPSPLLVIIGGVHIAVALTAMARAIGFRAVVVDPRRTFADEERFPDVDRLIRAWPEKALVGEPLGTETAVVTLTHDPKIDDPALRLALNSDAFYVGALGSRKTQEQRRKRLSEQGLSPAQIARIHGPVGLDIGAETPEEIALAIMAEVVRAYRNRP